MARKVIIELDVQDAQLPWKQFHDKVTGLMLRAVTNSARCYDPATHDALVSFKAKSLSLDQVVNLQTDVRYHEPSLTGKCTPMSWGDEYRCRQCGSIWARGEETPDCDEP